MQVLDGKLVAKTRRRVVKQQVDEFRNRYGRVPGLGVILVGEDPASQVYVRNKLKACQSVGMESLETKLPETATEAQLKEAIQSMNQSPKVDGFLVQLPLPNPLNSEKAMGWIDPKKDADGLTVENIGLLYAGRPRSIPCTPYGVMKILEHYQISVEGANAVVVGRSQIVGQPMAQLLLQANATVTVCHSRTKDLQSHLKKADLVVVAAGRPELLGAEDFKKNSVVIDVGIHRKPEGGLCGDVRFSELEGHVKAATPVPGGVGPMTIAMLLENTLRLARLYEQKQ